MTNKNWKVSFDRQFQLDVNKWKNQVADLQGELRDIVDYILEYGEIPSEYNPHKLTDPTLPYTGSMDFHLFDGKIDLLVIYTEINKHRIFRFMRLGSHNDLFH
ncbi:type II toxin-antitoxin system YafQ family toxin [Limosilactobacillus reuteri]|uniref:type II toxin-antitoxin system YafQ family toxin n=1 Tax=Limosilactobacillus reuteri TaxID=1598 RepID=UPI001E5E8E00|nr:type II toxin-antitoxin system YafQ family toxin [Limosilactobacillus reuteri]MCC4421095.1 type II toxin-antitoxin system YafQ family toxin [Limosilactobacillus reuteri]